MKQIVTILLLIALIQSFTFCSSRNQVSDQAYEKIALKITRTLGKSSIEVFKTWNYTPRGKAGIWYRNAGDSTLYKCIYLPRTDSEDLSVINYKHFTKDFEANIPFDSAYWRITITKQKGRLLKIEAVDHHGKDVLLMDEINQDSIFPTKNPFDHFKKLTAVKDSLKFYEVIHYKRLGGIIQFKLSSEHILTYVPNIDLIDAPFKKVWQEEFSKGKWINKYWNLGKRNTPEASE